jgi:hypothetical protein
MAADAGFKLAELFVDFTGRTESFDGAERGVHSKLKSLEASANKAVAAIGRNLFKIGAAVVAGVGAAVAAVLVLTHKITEFGDNIDKISKRTGVSAEALSELGFAAELSGQNFEALEKSIRGLQRSYFDLIRGSSEIVDAYKVLGLELKDLQGLTPEQMFMKVADAIGRLDDASLKAGVAMKIFGRSGSQLIPLFNEGAEGIERMRQEARRLGIVMSKEDAAAAAEWVDTMARLRAAIRGVGIAMWRHFGPTLERIVHKGIVPMIAAVGNWINKSAGLAAILDVVSEAIRKMAILAVKAYAGIETIVLNATDAFEIGMKTMQLAILGWIEDVKHFFGKQGPEIIEFFANTVAKTFKFIFDMAGTVWTNMVDNIKAVWDALMEFILHDRRVPIFWKPLTNGLKIEVEKWKGITARGISDAEMALADEILGLWNKVGDRAEARIAELLKMLGLVEDGGGAPPGGDRQRGPGYPIGGGARERGAAFVGFAELSRRFQISAADQERLDLARRGVQAQEKANALLKKVGDNTGKLVKEVSQLNLGAQVGA